MEIELVQVLVVTLKEVIDWHQYKWKYFHALMTDCYFQDYLDDPLTNHTNDYYATNDKTSDPETKFS